MADILIDVEVRGNQKVTTAVKNVQTLQANVKRLSDAMSTGSLSQRQYYKGIAQLAEATGKSEKELRDYATALRRVEKETKAAKVAQDQEREAVKAYAQARREATAANQRYDAELKKKAKSEEEAARAAAKHASEMEQIKNKYVPLYAASKQYERAIEELNQAYVQGALTQGQYLAAMENIDRQLANNRAAAVGNVRGMNAMGVAIQQTGYQVGDFLVQIQSGTNAFVAFGQQATQLVGVLPMFNPALVGISAALGVVIPLATAFGAAWMRTRDAARNISDVTSEVESATSALKELNREVNNFNQGITSSFDEMLAGLELNIELSRKAIEDMQKSNPLFTLPGSGFRMSDRVEELRAAEEALRLAKELVAERQRQREAEKMASDERLLGEQMLQSAREESLRIYEEEQRAIKETEDYILSMVEVFKDAQKRIRDEQRDRLAQANRWRESNLQGIRDLNFEQNSLIGTADEYVKKVAESFQKAQDLKEEIGDAAYEALRLAGVDIVSGVDAAAKAAAKLAADLGLSLAYGQAMVALNNAGYAKAAPGGPDQARADVRENMGGKATTSIPGILAEDIVSQFTLSARTPRGGSSGGGGGSTKTQEDYVGKLLAEAEQKRKLIGLSEEETRRQEILYQLKERGLPTDDKRIEQIIQMEAETRKLMEAEQQREQMMDTIENHIQNAFMTMVDGSQSVEDAFRNMLRNIILAIYQQEVAKPAATALGGLFNTAIGSLFGPGMTTGTPLSIPSSGVGSLLPSFDGGGFTGYGPRSGGMDGKGGMLAMVHPNETVIDHTKGQTGGGTTVVNNYFSMSANGDDSVKRIIRSEIPRITEATKAAVVDAKRRGGSYGRSF